MAPNRPTNGPIVSGEDPKPFDQLLSDVDAGDHPLADRILDSEDRDGGTDLDADTPRADPRDQLGDAL